MIFDDFPDKSMAISGTFSLETIYVWPIFSVYISGNIPTIHMAKHMVLKYLHLLDIEDLPLIIIYQ